MFLWFLLRLSLKNVLIITGYFKLKQMKECVECVNVSLSPTAGTCSGYLCFCLIFANSSWNCHFTYRSDFWIHFGFYDMSMLQYRMISCYIYILWLQASGQILWRWCGSEVDGGIWHWCLRFPQQAKDWEENEDFFDWLVNNLPLSSSWKDMFKPVAYGFKTNLFSND